jgi:DNA mismatch repair protein MutS2
MIFPSDAEVKIGFDQIRTRLENYCPTGLGKREVYKIRFTTEPEHLFPELRRTAEFKRMLATEEAVPPIFFFDAEELLKTVAIEGTFLEAMDLLQIARSTASVLTGKVFLLKTKEVYPELHRLAGSIYLDPKVPSSVLEKIDENGLVKDKASAELAAVRKRLKEEQHRVRKLVDQVFRNAAAQGWTPEGVSPTLRDGRVVIPLVAEHKRKIRGFLMAESATGQTAYVEPAEVLEANNDIRELELQERSEVIKILKQLTFELFKNHHALVDVFRFLARWELLNAKAKLAGELQANLPFLKPEPALNWIEARHPLLFLKLKKGIIPLTIDLNDRDRMLLVSGPNAGGKSVCLKTVGLIQYMLQCGLLIPVEENSIAGIFSDLFVDIGDQQSIENDLSTYSSHLRNMAHFIRNASGATMVLLDELGSGTDPNFGGAIAEAVLSTLVEIKTWGLATTHYYNLKMFAENHRGILNGAMLFDLDKLQPLFRLEIGRPGSSFALEIARKAGFPKATMDIAENVVGRELTGLEALMKTVVQENQELKKKEILLQQKDKKLEGELARYRTLSSDIELRKKEIINKAKEEASSLLKETNKAIEKTIRHIRENKAEKKETKKIRLSLQEHKDKIAPVKISRQDYSTQPLKPGDSVRLPEQEVSGTIISIKGKKAVVQFGDLRSTLEIQKLVHSHSANLPVATPIRSKGSGLDLTGRQSQFTGTLDIRGKRVDEVLPLFERFMDDAIILGYREVSILHGKGEGVLRSVIRDQLKMIRDVASVHDEHADRGGAGVTRVLLK